MGVIETKTFKSGNSVAVRLPSALGIAAGMSVTIERSGGMWTMKPARDPAAEKRKVADLIAALDAIGPVGEAGERLPVDIPDRATR